MFERFAPAAVEVITVAQNESCRMGHEFLGTEQLLLGLLMQREGIAAEVLMSLGIKAADVRQEVKKTVGGTGFASPALPFTPRAKRVLELSLQEATELGHEVIDTEHILLGLVQEGNGGAIAALKNLQIDPQEVRDRVIQRLNKTSPDSDEISSVKLPSATPVPASSNLGQSVSHLHSLLAEAADLVDQIQRGIDSGQASEADLLQALSQFPNPVASDQPQIEVLVQSNQLKSLLPEALFLRVRGQNN